MKSPTCVLENNFSFFKDKLLLWYLNLTKVDTLLSLSFNMGVTILFLRESLKKTKIPCFFKPCFFKPLTKQTKKKLQNSHKKNVIPLQKKISCECQKKKKYIYIYICTYKDPPINFFLFMPMVILFASVERFSVSQLWDLFYSYDGWTILTTKV